MTKKFNVKADERLNKLAVEMANGKNKVAETQFMEEVAPLMEKYARRLGNSAETREELYQEFLILAWKCAVSFVERYNNGTNNVLGLIYTDCRRKAVDHSRKAKTQKRGLYKNREISLQSNVGEEGDRTWGDMVASDEKDVLKQLLDQELSVNMGQAIKKFCELPNNRHNNVMKLVYVSESLGWTKEELADEIGKFLESETGNYPSNETIRKAKSRALKTFRKFVENGEISL